LENPLPLSAEAMQPPPAELYRLVRGPCHCFRENLTEAAVELCLTQRCVNLSTITVYAMSDTDGADGMSAIEWLQEQREQRGQRGYTRQEAVPYSSFPLPPPVSTPIFPMPKEVYDLPFNQDPETLSVTIKPK
jgi:hypothetical protein